MIKIGVVFYLVIMFACKEGFGQNNKKIDSLLNILKTVKNDEGRVNTLRLLAVESRELGKIDDAQTYAKQLLPICEKNLSLIKDSVNGHLFLKAQAKAYNIIGTSLGAKGNFEEARNFHYKALTIQQAIGEIDDLLDSYHRIGVTYVRQEHHALALEVFRTELKIALPTNDKRKILQAYTLIANEMDAIGNLEQAIKYGTLRLQLSRDLGDKHLIAGALDDLGLVYQGEGLYTEAIKKELESKEIFEQLAATNKANRDSQALADCYHNLGNAYSTHNEALSLNYYFKALKLRELVGNEKGVGVEYSSIANIYFQVEKYSEALEYCNLALEKLKPYKFLAFMADSYFTIGRVYSARNEYTEALASFETALKIREETNDRRRLAYVYLEMGNVYLEERNYTEAVKMYWKAYPLSKEVGDNSAIAWASAYLGEVYTKFADSLDRAKRFAEDALSFFKANNSSSGLQIVYEVLSDINIARNDYKEALENFKISSSFGDSLLKIENTERLVRTQTQFEFEKKQDSLKYHQQIVDEQLKHQTLLAKQTAQALLLKEDELTLSNKEKQIQGLAYSKTQSDLVAEQSKRKENEKQLIIADQEKDLQKSRLDLQNSELRLKDKELVSKQKQRNLLVVGTLLLMLVLYFIYRNFQKQQKINHLQKATAEKEKVELQLQSLRAQLNPHFMFNSLNAIQELIVTDKTELSQYYLERFARLLRLLLENSSQPFISLRKELIFLELYLSLESIRLTDLNYQIVIDPAIDLDNTSVPNMMLQPYIENALWHGLRHRQGEKKLELNIAMENGTVRYAIKDNGVGREQAAAFRNLLRKSHTSKGMELLSQRFALLSKEHEPAIETKITDLVQDGRPNGTVVEISVPLSIALTENKAYVANHHN